MTTGIEFDSRVVTNIYTYKCIYFHSLSVIWRVINTCKSVIFEITPRSTYVLKDGTKLSIVDTTFIETSYEKFLLITGYVNMTCVYYYI